jgi:hypothetical protein
MCAPFARRNLTFYTQRDQGWPAKCRRVAKANPRSRYRWRLRNAVRPVAPASRRLFAVSQRAAREARNGGSVSLQAREKAAKKDRALAPGSPVERVECGSLLPPLAARACPGVHLARATCSWRGYARRVIGRARRPYAGRGGPPLFLVTRCRKKSPPPSSRIVSAPAICSTVAIVAWYLPVSGL